VSSKQTLKPKHTKPQCAVKHFLHRVKRVL